MCDEARLGVGSSQGKIRAKGGNEEKKHKSRKIEIGDWKADKATDAVIKAGYVR